MNNQKETIRKFVSYINNESHLGGFWLPNIQRSFVWSEEQIERLFDSILREYPIGTLLVWKNKSKIKYRKFIDDWNDDYTSKSLYKTPDEKPKMLVLDGQQRMQSLFIGLKGSYASKRLYFDIYSGDLRAPDDIKFVFKFLETGKAKFPFVLFEDLVFTDKKNKELKKQIADFDESKLTEQQGERIDDNIELIRNVFCTQENIIYQEIDSIDRPDTYKEDDVVEIFIRANSGGTPLSKSDLLFSLLTASWDEADDKMVDLLDELNRDGFNFNRDFILKCCLVLLNKGAAYKVEKFREAGVRENIEENWKEISNALKEVKDFIKGKTFIRSDKVLSSYLTLVPIIYFRYHYPEQWSSAQNIEQYLIRTLLTAAFSGSPDTLIDKCVRAIDESGNFDVKSIFDAIREDNRSLELTKEGLLSISYWDSRIHLIFNLWYTFNYDPSYIQNEPQLDHIFPQSSLKKIKLANPETGKRNIMKYKWQDRDQLANMMLLTRRENGASGKSDTSAEKWLADKDEAYLDLHLIPRNKELWKLENFETFIEARKTLILQKFDYLLLK